MPEGEIAMRAEWPARVTPEWAWGGADGAGVRVAVLDSGIDASHPDVGEIEMAVAVTVDEHGRDRVTEDDRGDLAGHGTACASILRRLAPACRISSVRVLTERASGSGDVLIAGLRWSVRQRFDVINMSLSASGRRFTEALRELTDEAYFERSIIVASAHNSAVESFPWRFASVISVGCHQDPEPTLYYYNPAPPVEFFGCGVRVPVAWRDGRSLVCSGNSFATAHLSGMCARILSKHPDLVPFNLKSILYLTAANVVEA